MQVRKVSQIHASLSSTIYHAPFDVIHYDLWELTPFPYASNYLCYIAFVDAFTKLIGSTS